MRARPRLDLYGHLGFFPRQVEALMDRIPLGEGTGVGYGGAVPKAEVARIYADLDVLLFWRARRALRHLGQGVRVHGHGQADRVGAPARHRGQ